MPSAPIIFIHYGNASYLRYTLKAARQSNPDKRIILLGDEANRHLAGAGVEHFLFADLNDGPEIETFNRVFQLIKGENHTYRKLHGADHWTRFVFLRWFLILNFLRRENIGPFWTFDSDTLILAPLAPREPRFAGYDCTEQCVAQCMNGFISGQPVVAAYIAKINELFQRPDYLQKQREALQKTPGLAFTEMNAYVTLREEARLKTLPLTKAIDGEAFDDALCFVQNYDQSTAKVMNRMTIKKLLLDPAGFVFVREIPSGALVRMLTLNLSWMPDFIYQRLLAYVNPQTSPSAPHEGRLEEFNVSEPLSSKLHRQFILNKNRFRDLVKKVLPQS